MTTSHMASIIREQRAMNIGTQFAFLVAFSLGCLPTGWGVGFWMVAPALVKLLWRTV